MTVRVVSTSEDLVCLWPLHSIELQWIMNNCWLSIYLRVGKVIHDGRTDFSGIDVGIRKILVSKMKVLEECNWANKAGVGYGLNGMQFIGKKGDSYEVKVEGDAGQFGFIGAKYDSIGSASVYQNGPTRTRSMKLTNRTWSSSLSHTWRLCIWARISLSDIQDHSRLRRNHLERNFEGREPQFHWRT